MSVDQDFSSLASQVIDKMAEDIEEQDPECLLDVDLNNNILSINSQDGTYVINIQTPAREIWLSSPVSGPYHFSFKDGAWLSSKGANMFNILSNELKVKLS